MTRSVEDAALLYQLLQGEDPLDKLTVGQPNAAPMTGLKRGVSGLRLARIPESERAGVAPAILAAYDQALETLALAGAQIGTIALPKQFGDYTRLTSQIMQAEAYGLVGELAEDRALPIDESVRSRVSAGENFRGRIFQRAAGARSAEDGVCHRLRRVRRGLDPDDADDCDPGRRRRSGGHAVTFHPFCEHSRSLRPRRANRLLRRGAAQPRCRSYAAATTRIRRCASVGPISR